MKLTMTSNFRNSKQSAIATCFLFLLGACDTQDHQSDTSIVGGREVTAGDNGPEKVSTVGLSGCTGTIIAKDLILTAAHCYNNAVQGGYVLFGTQFNGKERKIVSIESAIKDSSYNGSSQHNDVALLKLAGEVPAGYKAIKMLPNSLPMRRGEVVRQAGYGSNNQPNSFGTLRTVDSYYMGSSQAGALYVENGKTAACSGDSGGPLFVKKNGDWYTAGITSTAYMDTNRACTGGNHYASTSQNYAAIVEMAKNLTGRANPLDAAERQAPEPSDLDDATDKGRSSADAPAKFYLLATNVTISETDLSIKVKNASGRAVRDCNFVFTPIRTWGGVLISYDLETVVKEAGVDQEIELRVKDPYINSSFLGNIQSVGIYKVCKG